MPGGVAGARLNAAPYADQLFSSVSPSVLGFTKRLPYNSLDTNIRVMTHDIGRLVAVVRQYDP